jgi:hypothetical protein
MSTDGELDMATIDKHVQKYTRQRRGSWPRRNWRWFLPLVLVAALVFAAGTLYWWSFARVYDLEACQSAMKALAADASARQALGEPIQVANWPSSVFSKTAWQEVMPSEQSSDEEVRIYWVIQGPKGRAQAHTRWMKRQGNWDPVELDFRLLPDGKPKRVKIAGGSEEEAKPWSPATGAATPSPKENHPKTNESDLNLDFQVPDAPTGGK